MLKDKNHTPVYVPTSHKWTPEEKQINCKICLLAENMRDCRSCPFYTPKIDAVSLMKGK